MKRILALLSIVLFCGEARAQHVYKCVDGKNVSYQSAPCANTHQAVKQWAATPEPPPSAEDLVRKRKAQAQAESESAYLRSLAGRAGTRAARRSRATGADISAARNGDRCAAAKLRRDATERKLGLNRTYESMEKLSRMIYEACR